jgi:uncharacterized protein YqfA (UPF0365 family)
MNLSLLAQVNWLDWLWLIIVLAVLLLLGIGFLILVPIRVWFRTFVSGAHISMTKLVGMRLRKININLLVEAYIAAKKAGLTLDIDELETHYMAGGNVVNVVNALIAGHSAKLNLSVDTAKAIDLAGRDVLQAVRTSVNPKVIETPIVSAVARDGIELHVKARVTVKANIGRLVGGAGEETILARVGEGIVTTVGSAEDHGEVLQNPDLISKVVLAKGLDNGTAYEILSIDIEDVDVGRNIGAQLRIEKAMADTKIANAMAEERRAMAVAHEQEMRAKTQEMNALKVKAEAEVPKAMAGAFDKGRLGIMDYYRMQNMVADTDMRKSLAGDDPKKKPPPR